METLFDKYGGAPFVTLVVRDFATKFSRHPNLRRYFTGKTKEIFLIHHTTFVVMALGKTPEQWLGKSMKTLHSGLGITSTAYELSTEIMLTVLRDHGVSEADLNEVGKYLKKNKTQIVEK
ncbi:MAG: group 1 truncated hemoglobin [Oxalobacteraceae bacterium]|nr:group 1 truncated hemoglobin [Oxalobacteraceae bacterium]